MPVCLRSSVDIGFVLFYFTVCLSSFIFISIVLTKLPEVIRRQLKSPFLQLIDPLKKMEAPTCKMAKSQSFVILLLLLTSLSRGMGIQNQGHERKCFWIEE